jgi:proteasome activator subunit 4
MVARYSVIEVGYPLKDPQDPRYIKLMDYRKRFINFLLRSSRLLREQGEENTVDAITTVISSFRTYLLENGSADAEDWGYLRNHFNDERNVARAHAGQTEWPRALWVLKARYYQSTRMRSNNMERIRTKIEDAIIDELVELSMYIYATVRSPAQNLLAKVTEVYDGVRKRVLPQIFRSLAPGTDDDRMKGALYVLNYSAFGKYAVTEPSQLPHFIKYMFGCQSNEKPSIQNVVATIAENSLSNLVEPCHTVYQTNSEPLRIAAEELYLTVPEKLRDRQVIQRNAKNCRNREEIVRNYYREAMDALVEIGNAKSTHWRYNIVALRLLRVLVRRDTENSGPQMEYLLSKAIDDHPSMRYYAQRGVMKMLRYLKVRSSSEKPEDLSLQVNRSPLRRHVPVQQPSRDTTKEYLATFARPIDWQAAQQQPLVRCSFCDPTLTCTFRLFQDKASSGWLAWADMVDYMLVPKDDIQQWETRSQSCLDALLKSATTSSYWDSLRVHYAEENQSDTVNWDNVSFVKSICRWRTS